MKETSKQKIKLDVLCVNQAMLCRDAFRRWSFRYENLEHFGSAEPSAFDGQENEKKAGITVHWNLPRSLRTENVLVPNRWRVKVNDTENPEASMEWVIESDCPNSKVQRSMAPENVDDTGSNYLLTLQQMRAFRKSKDPLRADAELIKRGKGITCQLGAVFPAEVWEERSDVPLFLTAIAPANPAFSQFVPHCRNIFSLTFYPKKEKAIYDIEVSGWYSVQPEGQENTVCDGSMRQVIWDLRGPLPENDPLQVLVDSGELNVSIGNSPYEALSAMLGQFVPKEEGKLKDALDAILLNCPDTLQNIDGVVRRQEKAHKMSFRGKHSAIRYRKAAGNLAAEQSARVGEVSGNTGKNGNLIQSLNQSQSILEQEQKKLQELQRELFDMWWKRGRFPDFPPVPGHSREDFLPYFDTDDPDSLISKTICKYEKVKKLEKEMPKAGQDVKAVPTQTFYCAENPVLLLLGVRPPTALEYQDDRQEVNEKHCVSWEPMYMEWRLGYTHVPFAKENWELTPQGYRLRENISGEPIEEYSGVALLGRQTQENFAERLEDVLWQETELQGFIQEIRRLPMLTVGLTGLNEKLIQRDVRSFVTPDEETVIYQGKIYLLKELLGSAIENAPYINWNVLNPFFGIRSGQMLLMDVILYDKFGRILNVVRSGSFSGLLFDEQFRVLPHESMKSSYSIYPKTDYPVQLRPRLMQAARVEAALERVEGIILVNELDKSLEIFSESGQALGIIGCSVESGKTGWKAAPGVRYCENREQIETISPVMAAWIDSWINRTDEEYQKFLDHIEDALYDSKFQPHDLTGISVYFSKPMILVKVKLSCVLDEALYHPQDWDSTFLSAKSPLEKVRIPFLIGNVQDAGDGLVGYYVHDSFLQMYDSERDAGMSLKPDMVPEEQTVYLLMDPSLSVHIYTDLLPVAEVCIKEDSWKELIGKLEQHIPVAPLLSWKKENKLMFPPVAAKEVFHFVQVTPEQTEYEISTLKDCTREMEGSMEVFEGYLIKKGEEHGLEG